MGSRTRTRKPVKTPRLWRYIVTDVGGFEDQDKPPVEVGSILIDKWKGQNAEWRIFDFKKGAVAGWFCGVKIDEYDGPRDAEGRPTSEVTEMTTSLHRFEVYICDLCLSDAGGECHVPGCDFWMDDAPSGILQEWLRDRALKAELPDDEFEVGDSAKAIDG